MVDMRQFERAQVVWVLRCFDPFANGPDADMGGSLWASKEAAVEGFSESQIEEALEEEAEFPQDGFDENMEREGIAVIAKMLAETGEMLDPDLDRSGNVWKLEEWPLYFSNAHADLEMEARREEHADRARIEAAIVARQEQSK